MFVLIPGIVQDAGTLSALQDIHLKLSKAVRCRRGQSGNLFLSPPRRSSFLQKRKTLDPVLNHCQHERRFHSDSEARRAVEVGGSAGNWKKRLREERRDG